MSQRGGGKLVDVELVEDGGIDDPTPASAPGRAGVTWRRRAVQLGVAGAVVVAVVVGLAIADTVSRRAQADRLRHAPGGVLTLREPPTTAWTASADTYAGAYYLPGIVVQVRADGLVGLDAESGAERWRVAMNVEATRCGASDVNLSSVDPVTDRLVCVRRDNESSASVVVLDATGQVSSRRVDMPFDRVWPAADGGLVTVKLIGTDPEPPAVTRGADGSWTTGAVAHGHDALVRDEDAATGAVRWERTVPFRPVPASDSQLTCFRFGTDDAQPVFVPTALWVDQGERLLLVRGCGLDAVIADNGTVLDQTVFGPETDGVLDAPQFEPYADGGVVATSQPQGSVAPGAVRSVLYDSSGSVEQTFAQQLLNPLATDGTDADVRLIGGDGAKLRAVDADGTVRWAVAAQPTALLVRAAGVAVVIDASKTITGLDLRTGDTLWTSQGVQGLMGDAQDGTQAGVAAFTDGQTVLVAVTNPTSSVETHLLAIDLHTGRTRWQKKLDGAAIQLHAVRGRLLEHAATGVHVTVTDGGNVWEAKGAELRALR